MHIINVYQTKTIPTWCRAQSCPHLMSPCERRVSVHVVLRLADINHLVGVQLEHALHLELTAALLCLIRGGLGHPLLLQLLPTSLALSDPSQVPEGQKNHDNNVSKTGQPQKKSSDHFTHQQGCTSHLQGKFAQISRLWQKSLIFTWDGYMTVW